MVAQCCCELSEICLGGKGSVEWPNDIYTGVLTASALDSSIKQQYCSLLRLPVHLRPTPKTFIRSNTTRQLLFFVVSHSFLRFFFFLFAYFPLCVFTLCAQSDLCAVMVQTHCDARMVLSFNLRRHNCFTI